MPRHEINRADWDTFLLQLERQDDERIVAVVPSLCDPHTLEVLTAPAVHLLSYVTPEVSRQVPITEGNAHLHVKTEERS